MVRRPHFDDETSKPRNTARIAIYIFVCLMGVVAILLVGRSRGSQKPAFFNADAPSVPAAMERFGQTGSNEHLMDLLVALCREDYRTPGSYAQELVLFGNELYTRSQAGLFELENIGNQEVAASVLEWLQNYQ